MSDLAPIALGAGLQDGFNPCIFMTCAVFIVHGIWVSKNSSHPSSLRLFFALTYGLCTFFFNFGAVGTFLFQKNFVLIAKIIYFGLGIGAFVLGVLFFKDWFLLRHKGIPVMGVSHDVQEDLSGKKIGSPTGMIKACLITFILGVVLSALATLWPINYYMVLLGTGALLKGQWQAVIWLLSGYTIAGMWPLWFLWSFLSIRNLRPSLLKIICASVFFAASSSTILIFK